MSEQKTDAIAIESEVPDKQELREGITEGNDGTNSKSDIKTSADEENPATIKEEFVYSPVITVTKEESTFTKGDVKLQKVIVSEDISDDSTTIIKTLRAKAAQTPNETHTEICSEVSALTVDTESDSASNDINNNEGEKQKDPKKISKIPKLRLKQVVERIKNEKRMIRNKDDNEPPSTQRTQRSSIPRLKDLKNPPEVLQKDLNQNNKEQSVVSPGVDAEFDKIYEQILEGESSNNLPSLEKISDPVKLEYKFEEIIHSYDDNRVQAISTEKIKSKIPLLKRKSEQEIEIPPPNVRRNSLNKSHTDNKDSKANIQVGVVEERNTFTSDVENVRKHNTTSSKIIGTKSSEMESEIIVKKSYNYINKTSLKSTSTQKSSEKIELVNISSTENINEEIVENKIDSKFTIPVITSSNQDAEVKINSASLNKHPMRKNIIDRLSIQHTMADNEDKEIENEVVASLPNTSSIVESYTNIGQNEKTIYTNSETARLHKKVISEQITTVSEGNYKNTYISSKTSYTDKNHYEEQNITTESRKSPVFDMPTIPNNLTKLEKSANINKKYSVSSDNLPNPTNNTSRLKENKQFENVTMLKNTSFYTQNLENQNKTQNSLTNKIKDQQSSSVLIHQNESVAYKSEVDNKSIIEQSSSFVTQKELNNNEKLALYINKDKNNTLDRNQFNEKINHVIKSSNVGEQENVIHKSVFKKSNDRYIEGVQTGIETVYAKTKESKEIRIKDETIKKTNGSDLISLEARVGPGSLTDNNNTKKIAESNIVNTTILESKYAKGPSEEQRRENNSTQQMNIDESRDTSIEQSLIYSKNIFKDNEKKFENLVSIEKNDQELNRKIGLYLSAQNTNINDTEEEDIIVLKGKVNRIIRRLDSKEYKASKKEIEDVPNEVSVISKIAIFENESTNTPLSQESEHNSNRSGNDKPKIVNEILKIKDKNDFNIPIQEKHVEHDFQVDKSTKKITNTEAVQSKINSYETTKNERNPSTTFESNEVFKEDQKSSLEIWNEYRMRKQASDIQRARSLAELDLGDAVNGRVKQMVVRMNSVERTNMAKKQFIDFKEKPRIGSVSQRIALFERKLIPIRGEDGHVSRKISTTTVTEVSSLDQGELERKIEDLKNAKVKYGKLEKMTYVELGDGRIMPALAVGTALLNPKLVQHVVRAAIDLGYRAFDTAFIYGNEMDVGIALQDKIRDGTVTREELFIVSKLWSTFHRRDLAEKACKQSLEAMGLDYFDLYLIHNPMSFKEGPDPLPKIANVLQYSEHDYIDAWFGIEGLVQKGLVKSAGVSNFNSVQIARLVEKGKIKPVINQVECHPYLTQQRLEEFCLSRNIKLSCFGVLGSKGTPADLTSGLPPVIDDPLVKVMAAGLGVTPAQLLISYQVRAGRNVVVKCSSAERLWDNGRALMVPLQDSHAAALDALNRNKRIYTFKGMGDTHRHYPFKIPF